MRGPNQELVGRAQQLADNELFGSALTTDRGTVVPKHQLQQLADAGLYGVSSTDNTTGAPESPETIWALIEALASGCLTTAFVWSQHLGAAAGAANAQGPVRDDWSKRLASGEARGGVAFAHMLRPGPALTTAEPDGAGGWHLTGAAPWVTGWGHIDVVHAAARFEDRIVWGLIDAQETATLRSEELELAAVQASQTVTLFFDRHPVPAGRVTSDEPYDQWRSRYDLGLRSNGSLALGVAQRSVRLLRELPDAPDLTPELDRIRQRLNDASIAAMPAARAEASSFAASTSAKLVAATGGRAITLSEHAQRLAREALFLLVQGQTPQIRSHLLHPEPPDSGRS